VHQRGEPAAPPRGGHGGGRRPAARAAPRLETEQLDHRARRRLSGPALPAPARLDAPRVATSAGAPKAGADASVRADADADAAGRWQHPWSFSRGCWLPCSAFVPTLRRRTRTPPPQEISPAPSLCRVTSPQANVIEDSTRAAGTLSGVARRGSTLLLQRIRGAQVAAERHILGGGARAPTSLEEVHARVGRRVRPSAGCRAAHSSRPCAGSRLRCAPGAAWAACSHVHAWAIFCPIAGSLRRLAGQAGCESVRGGGQGRGVSKSSTKRGGC